MATIVYSTSPNRVSSSTNQNQYSSYSSINKSMNQQHHHIMHAGTSSGAPPPLSIYQVKEHHNNYLMSHSRNYNYKRKSAVEMLAESKPYYVKSETVLDRHQQLNARGAGNNTFSCKSSSSIFLYWGLNMNLLSSRHVSIASSIFAPSFLLSSNINHGASPAFIGESTVSVVWLRPSSNEASSSVEHGKGCDSVERWHSYSAASKNLQWLLSTPQIHQELPDAADGSSRTAEWRQCVLSKCISITTISASRTARWPWCSVFL